MALSETTVIPRKRLLTSDYQLVPVVFAVALFISALLLFSVQPLVAKMVLPYLGGSPAVWNTCMVFFQVMLLGGYIYSHILPRKIGIRRHAILHVALMIVTAAFLPIGVSVHAITSLPTASSAPIWLLTTLLTTVGLPFFILSTTAPLLQSWFSNTAHRRARDPYFLYAASNLGSLLALLSYPILLEPNLKLRDQSLLWAGCYGLGFALIVVCACVFMARPRPSISLSENDRETKETNAESDSVISWGRRLKWVALALVPSSLMLGVTTYISFDLAAIPLLWVVPLSLYLLTFILQFSRGRTNVRRWERFLLPLLALPVVLSLASVATQRPWFAIPMHLAFFFAACMVCHGQLANDRPSSHHVTEFYLWISVGGALGGLFTALLAPALFNGVVEYPMMIVLACLLRPGIGRLKRWDVLAPFIILVLLCPLLLVLRKMEAPWHVFLGAFTLPMLVAYSFVERPIKFGLAMLCVLVASFLFPPELVRRLQSERNFFGVLRVLSDQPETMHILMHGTTIHGRQFIDPTRRCEPLSYYHRTGPFGSVFDAVKKQSSPHVAVVGLGVGTTAAYGSAGQEWTFYEIDPAVVKIARDNKLFYYLDQCSQARVNYVLGDGRLRLKEAQDNYYSLIALDAFSSDSIPLHLLTREAVGLYLSKLADHGIIAFHISNRHFNLAPALATVAKSYSLSTFIMEDTTLTFEEARNGKEPSVWVVMARSPEDLNPVTADGRWKSLSAPDNFRLWTDDFSNLLSVLKR
jgi:hypothetical protein